MKLRTFLLITCFPLVLIYTSCSNDFDVTAKYKEVAVVYGLLNQNDSIHYLRINKAFLGEGNALTYAKVADSSNYGTNIDVRITETTPTGTKNELVFDTVTLYSKEPGEFYSPGQIFYYNTKRLSQNNIYDLKITNKKTGYSVTSSTKLVNNFSFTDPSAGSKSLSFKRAITQTKSFAWENAKNGKRYQLILHFYYKEVLGNADTAIKHIDWVFPSVASSKTDGSGTSEVSYLNEDFFKLCEKNIPYTDAAREAAVRMRLASICDLELTVIGEDFNTYLDVNGPSTSVVMDKPLFSNITDGIGLFSSRYETHRIIGLNAETRLDLSNMALKFQRPQ